MNGTPPTGGEPIGTAVQGYEVPGRNPNSQMPWKFFLGNASHRLIAYIYGVRHPEHEVYYNTESISVILAKARRGDVSRLNPDERTIRPDITDTSILALFEIKPWNEQGLREGREEARRYLTALNRAILSGRHFTGGTDFQGEILIRFAGGQNIWRLEWRTTEPGVVQYQWTRSQYPFESEAAAYKDGRWVEFTEQELQRYGGWVAKAVEDMVERREKLSTLSGAIGIVIEGIGTAAVAVFSGAIFGRMGASSGAQQPPTHGGGQVIPFPTRPPATAPPARMPAAAGMSLPQ